MYSLKNIVIFLSALATVNALTTPLVVRHAHHRAIAARVPAPEPVEVPVVANVVKRQSGNNRRCKPRPSTSSSVAVAPTTTARPQQLRPDPTTTPPPPPPPPSPTPKPAPVTIKKPSPPSGNLPSFMIGTQTGQGTFYDTGLGACGIVNKDTDFIAAVSHLLFDNFPDYNGLNPNKNPMCGRSVTATFEGRSVVVQLTDRCTGCAVTDLDFSPSAFAALTDGNFGLGRISGVKWRWN